MRFRRRVKLFPGVTLNFSKTGISTTVGVPGASLNFNKQGTFFNTGIPICLYGNIEIKSSTGLNEAYCLSNHDKAERFSMTFKAYQKNIGQ